MKRIEVKYEDFFEIIDSEIKAYLLGFFAADGHVSKNENRIGINIAKEDEYILKLFQKYISPNSIIYDKNYTKGAINRKPQVNLRFSSKKIKNDLKRYDILPNKTINSFSMKNIPYDLKNHFIRGYFDGDGCIYIGKSQGRNKCCVNFTNGTRKILDEINEYFNNINFKLEIKISKTNFEYYVLAIYNKKEIEIFFNKLYNNSNYFLDRKYNKFNFVNTVLT